MNKWDLRLVFEINNCKQNIYEANKILYEIGQNTPDWEIFSKRELFFLTKSEGLWNWCMLV